MPGEGSVQHFILHSPTIRKHPFTSPGLLTELFLPGWIWTMTTHESPQHQTAVPFLT